jgi:hypothetical protein
MAGLGGQQMVQLPSRQIADKVFADYWLYSSLKAVESPNQKLI